MSSPWDLHAHSAASDGTLSPAGLVRRAAARGVRVLALTDHDTTAGLAEAAATAEAEGVELVPGVELSTAWEGVEVHVVGLWIDPAHPALQAGLERQRRSRLERARAMGERLARAGIPGAYEGARALAGGEVVNRSHFARFLVASGHGRDLAQAFGRYLQRGRPGYAPPSWVPLAEGIGWIRAAGGVAVLAHPGRYRLSGGRLRRLVAAFRGAGGEAIEVVSGSHGPAQMHVAAGLARRFGLLASVGSDFHVPGNPWRELGRLDPLPDGCVPVWEARSGPALLAEAGP